MNSYDALHRQCRTLESLFDSKLASYSRLATTISDSQTDLESSGNPHRWRDLEHEMEDILEKLTEANDQLSVLAGNVKEPPSQSMLRAIQRHRDVLQEYTREAKRTKANVQEALDRANLLTGVRNDIDAYKTSAADSLLAERGRIDSSHRMIDDISQQAYATRAEFANQRSAIAGINSRMAGVISTMPGINNVVALIKSRRRRDSIIMGIVIGTCMILLLTYMWN